MSSIFPFLSSSQVFSDLKEELPLYLAKSTDVDSSFSSVVET